jgi:hypothetical protein
VLPLVGGGLGTALAGPRLGAGLLFVLLWVSLPYTCYRVWSIQRSRIVADVLARPVATSPVSATFGPDGIAIETIAGRSSTAWSAVSDCVIRYGFLVVEIQGTPVMTAPLAQIGATVADQVIAAAAGWRESPLAPPELELPAVDATWDLLYTLEPGDHAAIARRVMRDYIQSREPYFLLGAIAGALLAVVLVALAFVARLDAARTAALVLGASVIAGMLSGRVWLPWMVTVVVWRRLRKFPGIIRPMRLLAGPGGFWMVGPSASSARRWSGMGITEEGGLILFVLAPRAIVGVPKRAFATPDDAARFAADVRKWMADAPRIDVPPPSVAARGVPPGTTDNPFAPPPTG